MKKLFIIIPFLLVFLSSVLSQEQKKHEKKYFADEEGDFYYNRSQPVYFWVSTSPTDNSKDVLLKSEKSPQYSNPLYFDQDGYNTLRSKYAVDTTTRKKTYPYHDVRFEIGTDGTPPVSTIKFMNANKYISNKKIYYGKNLETKLTSKDNLAGVEQIYYSINGANYKEYNDIIEFDEENSDLNLKFYAVDRTGNAEKVHEYNFAVDLSAPVVTQKIEGKLQGDILSQDATISLESEDNMSGVKKTYYSIDNGKPILYTKPISAYSFMGGNHKLKYYSIDNVNNNTLGNRSQQTQSEFAVNFTVDKSPPTVDIEFIGDTYKGNRFYVSARTKFKLTATDEISEIDFIKFDNNNNSYKKFTVPTLFQNKEGHQTIKYYSQDIVGNISTIHKSVVYFDNTEPVTYIDYGSPKFFHRDTLFINNTTKIILHSNDNASGIDITEYSIDNGTYKKYDNPFTISEAGFHKISFKSTDRVNNTEQIKESNIFIDNTPPEIFINFSIQAIRTEKKNGNTYPVYPPYSKMYLSATDKNTGEEDIFYSINGSRLKKYISADNIANAKLLSKEQFYTVKIIAKDKLGNKNEKIINFFISKK